MPAGTSCGCWVGASREAQFQITEDNLQEVLGQTKFEYLPGCNGQARHYLRGLGIVSAADMQTLPLSLLVQRFGDSKGKTMWEYCRGIDPSGVQDRGPPKYALHAAIVKGYGVP